MQSVNGAQYLNVKYLFLSTSASMIVIVYSTVCIYHCSHKDMTLEV